MNQIKPLPQGAPVWEYETSEYPDLMKQPMENGRVETYRHEVQQPEPRVMKCIDLIREMKRLIRENSYGGSNGGYEPRYTKRTGERRKHSTGQTQK